MMQYRIATEFDAVVKMTYFDSERVFLLRRLGYRCRERGEPHRPRIVHVRGHDRAVRVPETENPLSVGPGHQIQRHPAVALADGKHRLRPDLDRDSNGRSRRQRQRAHVRRKAHCRRVPGTGRGQNHCTQTPRSGQG